MLAPFKFFLVLAYVVSSYNTLMEVSVLSATNVACISRSQPNLLTFIFGELFSPHH